MASTSDTLAWSTFRPIYERILELSTPLKFPAPWDFIHAPPHCVGPVADPTAVLADLRGQFDEASLREAGVLSTSDKQGLELSPLFTDPDAALVALYGGVDKSLVGLLTARGCLPLQALPTILVLREQWTYDALQFHSVLYATPDIREVALLRALRMPATPSHHLHRLTYAGLQELENLFFADPQVDFCSYRPTLALLGWSLLSLSAQPNPALLLAVKHLMQARKNLEMELSGILTWRLSSDDVEDLRHWVKLRDAESVQQLLRKQAAALDDLEILLLTSSVTTTTEADPGNALARTRAALVDQLANAPAVGPLPDRARRAREVHDEQVQRTLVEPLEKSFLASSDPLSRNIGVQLTRALQWLHGMDPLLDSQLSRQFDRANQGVSAPLPAETLKQFLALTGRAGSLVRDLCQWRKD
jgi:hypothetical protein